MHPALMAAVSAAASLALPLSGDLGGPSALVGEQPRTVKEMVEYMINTSVLVVNQDMYGASPLYFTPQELLYGHVLDFCTLHGIPHEGDIMEMRAVCKSLLDLMEHRGVRFQTSLRHAVRGMQDNVFVNLRIVEMPERWYKDATMPFPKAFAESAMSEHKRVIIEELAALTEVKKKPSPKGSGGKRKPSPKGKGSASSGLAPPSPQTEEKTTAKLALTDIATEAYKERKRLTSVTPLVGGSSSVGAGEAVEPAVSLPPRPSSIPPPGVDIHSPPSAAATGATMGASASAFSPFPLGGMGNGAGAGLTTNSGFNGLQNSINANPLFLAALSAAASSAANPFAAGLPQGYAAMGAAAAGMGLAMGGWGSPFAQQLFPLGGGFNPLLYANAYGAYLAAQQQQAQQQQAQQQAALQLAPSSLPFQLPSPSTLQQPQPPQPLQPQKKQPKRPKQQQPQPPPPKQEEVMPSMPKAEPLPLPLPRAKPQELLVDIARAESSSPFPFFETSPFEQPKKKARKQSQQQGKEKAAAAAETRTAALTGGGAPAAIKPLPPLSAIAVEAPEAATLEMGEKRESPGSVHVPPSTPPLLEEQEGAKGGGEQKAEAFAKEGSPAGKEGKELEPRGQEKGNGKGQEQGQVGTDAGRGMKRMEGGKVVFDEAAFWM